MLQCELINCTTKVNDTPGVLVIKALIIMEEQSVTGILNNMMEHAHHPSCTNTNDEKTSISSIST